MIFRHGFAVLILASARPTTLFCLFNCFCVFIPNMYDTVNNDFVVSDERSFFHCFSPPSKMVLVSCEYPGHF